MTSLISIEFPLKLSTISSVLCQVTITFVFHVKKTFQLTRAFSFSRAGNDVSLVAMASKKMAAITADWVLQDSLITKIVQRLPSEGDKTVDNPEKVIESIKRTVKNKETGKQANCRNTFFAVAWNRPCCQKSLFSDDRVHTIAASVSTNWESKALITVNKFYYFKFSKVVQCLNCLDVFKLIFLKNN